MALARVVSFENVSKDRIEELKREIERGGATGRLPSTEILSSTTPPPRNRSSSSSSTPTTTTRRATRRSSATPAGDTPGRRASVSKYEVALRMTVWTASRRATTAAREPERHHRPPAASTPRPPRRGPPPCHTTDTRI